MAKELWTMNYELWTMTSPLFPIDKHFLHGLQVAVALEVVGL